MAVDTAGNLYVTDSDNNRVLKLPAGSNTPSVLPFTGLHLPCGVAVDAAGNVYVTDMSREPGGEAAGGVMRRTAGARGCGASPTEAT